MLLKLNWLTNNNNNNSNEKRKKSEYVTCLFTEMTNKESIFFFKKSYQPNFKFRIEIESKSRYEPELNETQNTRSKMVYMYIFLLQFVCPYEIK